MTDNPMHKSISNSNPVFAFHDGPISKKEAMEYEPKFTNEYNQMKTLFHASDWFDKLVDKKLKYVMNDDERGYYEILGLFMIFSYYPLSNIDWLIEAFGLPSRRSISDVLQIGTWSFVVSTAMEVWPLWIVTVYSMITPPDFLFDSCAAPTNLTATPNQLDSESFQADCGYLPMHMYSSDYPHRPALSSVESPNTNCTGIASGISNTSYMDSALVQQYVIYASLGMFTRWLSQKEEKEKRYVRISLYLKGVFSPCEDAPKLHSPTSVFFKYPVLGAVERYVSEWFIVALVVWYFITITYTPVSKQTYYLFPSSADQLSFIAINEPEYSGWCDLLEWPIKVTYIKTGASSNIALNLLSAWIFLCTAQGVLVAQKAIYDWIDPDEFMNEEEQENCPYYNVHNYRSRNFNEIMLQDWITANVFPHMLEDVKKGRETSNNKGLKQETVDECEKIVQSIMNKLNSS